MFYQSSRAISPGLTQRLPSDETQVESDHATPHGRDDRVVDTRPRPRPPIHLSTPYSVDKATDCTNKVEQTSVLFGPWLFLVPAWWCSGN